MNIYDNTEKDWKKFTLYDQGNGMYSMECRHTGLTVTSTAFSNGANVIATPYTGNSNQRWRFIPMGSGAPSLYLEDFTDGHTFKRMSTTTLNGNAAGSMIVPSSGNNVAKDELALPFSVSGLNSVSASMKVQLPQAEIGDVEVSMIVRVALQGGGDVSISSPTKDVESPMVGQYGIYQESIDLPAGAQAVTEVRIRMGAIFSGGFHAAIFCQRFSQ